MPRGNLRLGLLVLTTVLAACAVTDTRQEEALRDFVEVEALAERDRIATSNRDRRQVLNKDYLLYEGRKETFLIKFHAACYSLLDDRVVPDKRGSRNEINARFETINGCIIETIYALTDAQAAEIKEVAEATR
jgi:hypothetical protein